MKTLTNLVTVPSKRLLNRAILFESLGEDCEFGFVLSSLSLNEGSYFRWAQCSAHAALNLVESRFEGCFEKENLTVSKFNPKMIYDLHYRIAYHSTVQRDPLTGVEVYWRDGEEARNIIYPPEFSKRSTMASRFLRRLERKRLIYVIKSNESFTENDLERFTKVLKLADTTKRYLCIVKIANKTHPANEIKEVGHGLLIARIAHYADGNNLDKPDLEGWYALLSSVLDIIFKENQL